MSILKTFNALNKRAFSSACCLPNSLRTTHSIFIFPIYYLFIFSELFISSEFSVFSKWFNYFTNALNWYNIYQPWMIAPSWEVTRGKLFILLLSSHLIAVIVSGKEGLISVWVKNHEVLSHVLWMFSAGLPCMSLACAGKRSSVQQRQYLANAAFAV